MRSEAAAEAAELVLDAGGFMIEPGQLARIVALAVKLGAPEAIKRLERSGA